MPPLPTAIHAYPIDTSPTLSPIRTYLITSGAIYRYVPVSPVREARDSSGSSRRARPKSPTRATPPASTNTLEGFKSEE